MRDVAYFGYSIAPLWILNPRTISPIKCVESAVKPQYVCVYEHALKWRTICYTVDLRDLRGAPHKEILYLESLDPETNFNHKIKLSS